MNNLRTPLATARALGSGRNGTRSWLAQRLTALALIPLALAAVVLFFWIMRMSYVQAIVVLHQPWVLLFVVLLVGIIFWHGFLGLKVVIEDYVPQRGRSFALITAARLVAVTLALLGIVSAALVAFRSFSA